MSPLEGLSAPKGVNGPKALSEVRDD